MAGPELLRTSFDELPGWADDDHLSAYSAFRRSAEMARTRRYRAGSLGIGHEDFEPAFSAARSALSPSARQAREFFQAHFIPCLIRPSQGGTGFVTGFYEPFARARRTRGGAFRFPILKRPSDLVEVEKADPADFLPEGYRYGRMTANGLVPFPDRAAIETGALDGLGLEIAWLSDRVDLFFIHVQGAARLEFPGGRPCRITYAAKSGHPFTGPGQVLAGLGEIRPGKVTMQAIRAWFERNPHRIDEILRRNRSYIFFRESESGDPELGPFAAAKVQLTAGRSLAVDRLVHTFSTPFYVSAPGLAAFGSPPFRRLMIAQDTGSAIVGPARGDIFTGSGDEAGEMAGVIRHKADFHVLVPAAAAGRLAP